MQTEKPTAPCEVWNAYNNDVGRTREGRAALHAQGINCDVLKSWHGLPPAEHQRIRIALGLATAEVEAETVLAAAA